MKRTSGTLKYYVNRRAPEAVAMTAGTTMTNVIASTIKIAKIGQ